MKKIIPPNDPAHHIAVFQETTIRRVWHNEEWWFALSDVIVVLTDSADPRQYIKKMRSRDPALDANWGTTCTPLALRASDGKMRETNCANTEGLFRIIQSISRRPRPSRSNAGWRRWVTSGSKKLKTQNWPAPVPASFIRPRVTRRHGSRSGCVPSPCAGS